MKRENKHVEEKVEMKNNSVTKRPPMKSQRKNKSVESHDQAGSSRPGGLVRIADRGAQLVRSAFQDSTGAVTERRSDGVGMQIWLGVGP